MIGEWVTTAELAKRFGLTPRRIRALIASRSVRTKRVGNAILVHRDDVPKLKPGRPGRPTLG